MNNDPILSEDLENALKSYSIAIEYWTPDMCDTFLAIGTREFLQKHLADLNESQKQILAEIDKQVIYFADCEYETVTDDIEEIRIIADIINGKPID